MFPDGDVTPNTAHEWMSMVAQAAGQGLTLSDAQRRIVWVNESFTRLTGYSSAEAVGSTASELLRYEGTDADTMQSVLDSYKARRGFRFDLRVRSKDGREWWLLADARPLTDSKGELKGWVCVYVDATQARMEELRISESKLRSLYDLSPLGIALNDMGGRFLEVNRAVEMITGYSPQEILETNWLDLAVTDGNSNQRRRLESLLHDGRFGPDEMSLRRKDGSRVPVQITGIIVQSTDGTRHIWSMIEDISVRKRSEQRISFLAYHDALTGLENRLGLRSKLEAMLRASRQSGKMIAVALIDLDRFKYVNDTLGHDAGDELLVEIARRVRQAVREDDAVARLGGDEFVLVLDELENEAHVDCIVQKLFNQLRGNIPVCGRPVYTTCSIGVSLHPRDGSDSSTLMKHADLAMYAAKAQGGDCYRLFHDGMRPGTDRLSVEVELREALERGEFGLYYQPRMNAVTGRPTAVEALLRWNHPTRGLVLPGSFITIAEESGQIESIGQWVLAQACRDARAWLDGGGEPLRMSVNLSPVQFAREDLTERISAVLTESGLPARLLQLEVTETTAMRSPELAARHIGRLRELGVSIAVDDFGTGHSSLSRLKLLNVDCVKIDQSLVRDCAGDPHDAALCRAAIALGRALGLEVVAEGVETAEQRQFLVQEGCTTIQGYMVARPMPVSDAFAMVRSLLDPPRLQGAVSV